MRLHVAGHSSTSHMEDGKHCRITPPNTSYQRDTWQQGASSCSGTVYVLLSCNFHNSVVLGLCAFTAQTDMGCTLPVVRPEGNSSVCRGRQEGKILGVPPALNHFVLVLPYHHNRKLLGKIPLQVCHFYFHVVRAC